MSRMKEACSAIDAAINTLLYEVEKEHETLEDLIDAIVQHVGDRLQGAHERLWFNLPLQAQRAYVENRCRAELMDEPSLVTQ